jgi:hypothetical protein
MLADDTTIHAAIAAHARAFAALHAHAAVAVLGDRIPDSTFAQLEQCEREALHALAGMTPETVGGYRAVAAHLSSGPVWADLQHVDPELFGELLRAFASRRTVSTAAAHR